MTTKPVILVDLSAIFRAAYHASGDEATSAAFEGTLAGVRRAANFAEGALVAICVDGKGGAASRKALSPEYKAHREKQPESMYGLLDRTKARLAADGYLLWECDGYEADDVIATATAMATAEERGHSVIIATHDKDALQLVGPTVSMLKTSTWDVVSEADVVTKYAVTPAQFGDFLALCGDSSDGIKGAPGVGPKKAADLLKKYGDLDHLFDAVANFKVGEFTPALLASLRDNVAQVRLARQLVALRFDAPIVFSELYAERKIQPLVQKDWGNMSDEEMFNDGAISQGQASAPPPSTEEEHAKAVEAQESAKAKAAAEYEAKQRPEMNQETAIARREEAVTLVVEYRQALEPRSFKEALLCARVMENARLYQKYKNPEAMAAVIMRGREMGLGAGASLDAFHVNPQSGALMMHAHLIIDRAIQHPDCEFFEMMETSATSATYEAKHRKHRSPKKLTYTIEQAKLAGIIRAGGNWTSRPDEMLRKTCGVQLARILFPGAALGLYSLAEMGFDE